MSEKFNQMTKEDVKAGRRFFHKDDHHSSEFSFRKQFGNKVLKVVKNYSGNVAIVSEIKDDGFKMSAWLFNQEVSIFIPYSELLIIEPKNK